MAPKKKKIEFWDYFEVETEVERRMGVNSLREYIDPKTGKKHDFWTEWLCDSFPGNDCYVHIYFEAQDEDEPMDEWAWIDPINATFRDVIGADHAVFWISW
jgi:hypothetical protein